MKSNDGWIRLYSFAAVTSVGGDPQKIALGPWYGLLRYLRWKVGAFTGGSGRTAQFVLAGLGRA
ncbi:MAG: hypothetical protein HY909_18865 [Deltaproteobacteria bacterium]|nr:hypothetical protein [Deltaproteobacteria bacterium]